MNKENYYLNKVVQPLFELNLETFNLLLNTKFINSQCLDFINHIKLSKEKIKKFNDFLLKSQKIKKTTIEKEQLLVNAEYIDMSELTDISKINEKFFEFNYNNSYSRNNKRKGTMSFTSCYKIEKSYISDLLEYNSCRYIVSLAEQFTGCLKYKHIKRLLCFQLLNDIDLFEIINCNNIEEYNQTRKWLESEYTKLLLTDKFKNDSLIDYDLDFELITDKDIPFSGCSTRHNCLPEQFIYYFLELYSDELYKEITIDKIYEHNGCIILDTPQKYNCSDTQTHYKGFEFRIYNAHLFVALEAIYCINNNKFYLIANHKNFNFKINKNENKYEEISHVSEEKQKCDNQILCNDNYSQNNYIYIDNFDNYCDFVKNYLSYYLFVSKHYNDKIIKNYNYLCDVLNYYCENRKNIFSHIKTIDNNLMIRRKNFNFTKYLKYKKKYLLLKKIL
jgi:hypothetical protein